MKYKLAAAAALLCLGPSAMAAYTINVAEIGGNVVASGSGSINTSALLLTDAGSQPMIRGGNALLYIGGNPVGLSAIRISEAGSITGPTSFGTAFLDSHPSAATGGIVGIVGVASRLFVPPGYTSQSYMASTATWTGASFASLNLTPGNYTWTWGVGPTADSITVHIGLPPATSPASIPTLSEWGAVFLASVMAMLGLARLRRR